VKYRTIVADPPWPYAPRGGGFNLRSSTAHRARSGGDNALGVNSVERYSPMTIEAICALSPPADDNAHLHLWTTNAFLDEAHDVVRAWGFAPKTVCTWVKVQPDGKTPSMKTGHYFRGATEHWIFAVRGRVPFPDGVALPTAFLWPRLTHSVKPDAFYDVVERVSPGPYLEMFARRARFGWSYWGDESLGTALLGGAA
jgi:N6-adenosine-specific RNA methylase IME4